MQLSKIEKNKFSEKFILNRTFFFFTDVGSLILTSHDINIVILVKMESNWQKETGKAKNEQIQ